MNKRILIFASGRGSNAEALHEAAVDGTIKGRIVGVICDHHDAPVLQRAERWKVPATVIEMKTCRDKADYNEKILEAAKSYAPDLICLAGYMRICGENLIKAFENRIINVHPSLIPSFCGEGFYGLRVHEAALAKGVKVTGATVHFVSEVVDGGAIIAQKAVEVEDGDTPETLQKRVMQNAEWILLPQAVSDFCAGRLRVDGAIVHKN